MTVPDAATAGGVPAESPLRDALTDAAAASPVQAVTALGEAVHGAALEAIIGRLREENRWPRGPVTYGSAYSGVDVAAAIVHRAAADGFEYAFASEPAGCRRRVLTRAWGAYGLSEDRLYADAGSHAARNEVRVDVYVITPTCQAFSRRNHDRQQETQGRALAGVYAALAYVRHAGPGVVVL